MFLDAKHSGDDENVKVSIEDESGEKNEKAAQADGMKKGENKKESEPQEKEGGEMSMPNLSVGSKKRKSSVEKSLDLVFDKFKQANSEDFERYIIINMVYNISVPKKL